MMSPQDFGSGGFVHLGLLESASLDGIQDVTAL